MVEGEVTFADLRRAVVHGSVLASFNVEQFSLERMRSLSQEEIRERYDSFRLFSQFEVIA
jgi:cytidine kinase